MKKLSKNKYWNKLYNIDGFNNYSKLKILASYSLQNYEYFKLIGKHIKKNHRTIFEVGCAPGSFLIKMHNKFRLIPYGVDYSLNGKKISDINLKRNNINKFNIIYSDVFNKNFERQNKGKYDIVMSNGFVEHFDNFSKVLKTHINLCRIHGLIVINIPNLLYLNKYLTIKKVQDICNLEVMNLKFIRKNIPKSIQIKELKYYGGLFNLGLFFFENGFLEWVRKLIFYAQRLVFDSIGIFLAKMNITFNWKYSSPGIVLIGEKIK